MHFDCLHISAEMLKRTLTFVSFLIFSIYSFLYESRLKLISILTYDKDVDGSVTGDPLRKWHTMFIV